ncbi:MULTISPECIES: MerR family transcriptional regulator [unclassified Clostridium]|uniref:MerR family transcriptional regulator n=1 Tax=unclassified Clostridium TaxID=2614128 RepID=UPI0013E89EB7|nr:MerR family transcriptional regulator [Clostridium sp. JN-9]
MEKYFSIGEISKLSNLSVQTLRHYDKLGLLKPSLAKDNGYRYYSLEQFYKLDLIIFYRKLGLSLSEIKEIISNKANIEDALGLLQNQEYEMDRQIKELQKQRNLIQKKNQHIKSMLAKPLETAFLNEKPKKKIAKVNMENKNLEDAEISFRKALNTFPKLDDLLNLEVLYEINYEQFNKNKEAKYNIYFNITDNDIEDDENIKVCELQEGLYASILYIDYYSNYEKYVRLLFKFIEDENLKAEGSLYESYIASEFCDDREKGFIELFIKVAK